MLWNILYKTVKTYGASCKNDIANKIIRSVELNKID